MSKEPPILTFREQLAAIRNGTMPKTTGAKPKKPLRKIGLKTAAQNKAEKELRGNDDTQKEKWFQARRKEMSGTCCCGCGEPSQKKDEMYFRHCACHIFPQRLFESIQFHKLNWVERKFWATNASSGCHTNMDEKSMDLWVNFGDWDDIKEKFRQLAPLLTDEERAIKFYKHLEKLVYGNS